MDAPSACLLFGAGLAGGMVTAVVGGASLITFPALLAAGLPAVVASASNTVALTPGNFAAAFADMPRFPRRDRALLGMAITCIGGSALGAALLLATPERAFTAAVPVLIGASTAMFAVSGRIRERLRARQPGAPASRDGAGALLLAPVAVYGGYFGAGMSIMLLAILSATRAEDFRAANVLKNLLSGLTSAVALAVFVVQGVVAWAPALVMMAGTVIGGFAGGRVARFLPLPVVRAIVTAVGAVLTVIYAVRIWWR